MRVLDPIHKYITFSKEEGRLIDSTVFQRLRHIRQLGFAEFAFPGAVHNRFLHSLGVCHLAGRAFDSLLFPKKATLPPKKQKEFRKILRITALLHDLGHGPLSHISETAMPPLADLKLPGYPKPLSKKPHFKKPLSKQAKKSLSKKSSAPEEARHALPQAEHAPLQARHALPQTEHEPLQAGLKVPQAGHEHYTLKLILETEIKQILENMDIDPFCIAHLVDKNIPLSDKNFFISEGVDFKPLLKQIISSELDMDRMDYLQRDSFFCGTDYGFCDHEWILNNLRGHIEKDQAFLGVGRKAMYSVESFMLGRRHMDLAVYFHNKMVAMDEMLCQYFLSKKHNSFRIPVNTKDYIHCTDDYLLEHLKADAEKNPWAKRIVEKKPYERSFEIQYTQTQKKETLETLKKEIKKMQKQNIPYIHTNSWDHVHKLYFAHKKELPIYIVDEHTDQAELLSEKTKMFHQKEHILMIHRLYTPPNTHSA